VKGSADGRAPVSIFAPDEHTTSRLAHILAEALSIAAMHSPDRNARQRLLAAAGDTFDASADLERYERRALAGGGR
jgi:hypothetical protein